MVTVGGKFCSNGHDTCKVMNENDLIWIDSPLKYFQNYVPGP